MSVHYRLTHRSVVSSVPAEQVPKHGLFAIQHHQERPPTDVLQSTNENDHRGMIPSVHDALRPDPGRLKRDRYRRFLVTRRRGEIDREVAVGLLNVLLRETQTVNQPKKFRA